MESVVLIFTYYFVITGTECLTYLPMFNTVSTDEFTKCIHTHPFNGPLSGTTRVGRDQKGKTKLDFTEARDSEWQWHPLGHMQVCTSLQADNHASTPPLSFLQAGCPSCYRTNSVKALKAKMHSKDKYWVHLDNNQQQ